MFIFFSNTFFLGLSFKKLSKKPICDIYLHVKSGFRAIVKGHSPPWTLRADPENIEPAAANDMNI